jgi:hypothetical protein
MQGTIHNLTLQGVTLSDKSHYFGMNIKWFRTGVFNLSDSVGHTNNFNDARRPQSYTAAFRIVSCIPDTQRKLGKVAGVSI